MSTISFKARRVSEVAALLNTLFGRAMPKFYRKAGLLFFSLSYSLLAHSQGLWTQKASLPDSSRAAGIGFSIGNYGYAGLGTHLPYADYPCLKDFWQYNPVNNTWTRKADFPGKARICPATFVIGKYAYVVTGQTDDSASPHYTTECWQYSSITNKWAQKANFPGMARAYDVGFAIGGKGFVGTGSQYLKYYRKDFWEYDTATNSWKQIADFGGTPRFSANGFAVNGHGYVCWGADTITGQQVDMWEYDTTTKIWTQKSNCPGDSVDGAAGFSIATNIYVGTGEGGLGNCFSTFWEYRTLTDTWIRSPNFSGTPRGECSAFAVADSGYIGLGIDCNVTPYNDLYKFYPDTLNFVDDLSNNNLISIFPNPATQTLNLSFKGLKTGLANFSITDITGRIVRRMKCNFSNSLIAIDVSSLSAGLYILNIQTLNNSLAKKFIKQ